MMDRRDLLKAGVPAAFFAAGGLYVTSTEQTDVHLKNETDSVESLSVSIQREDGGEKQYAKEFTLRPNETLTEESVLSNGEYHIAIETEDTSLEQQMSNEFCWNPTIYIATFSGGVSLSTPRCWYEYVRS